MSTIKLISLFAMAGIYLLAGIGHFLMPKFFLKITPKWVPFPEKVNILVGVIEITLGVLLLFSTTQHYAALGIIALLVAVFPANIYHYQRTKSKGKNTIPTLIRLPIQALLIYWAYSFL
jgi:uncharacterized membrane protein